MTLADRDILTAPAPHRWNFDDFMRASEAGIFDSQDVELIEGELIDMPSQKDPHAWAISRLVHEMMRLFPSPYWVKIQATVRLNNYSGPEPDVALMSGPPCPPATVPPVPLLMIEVSETTLKYNLGTKAMLYAANGISDYWVADVIAKKVHVFREPIRDASQKFGWRFNTVTLFGIGDRVVPLAKHDVSVEVAAFLS